MGDTGISHFHKTNLVPKRALKLLDGVLLHLCCDVCEFKCRQDVTVWLAILPVCKFLLLSCDALTLSIFLVNLWKDVCFDKLDIRLEQHTGVMPIFEEVLIDQSSNKLGILHLPLKLIKLCLVFQLMADVAAMIDWRHQFLQQSQPIILARHCS